MYTCIEGRGYTQFASSIVEASLKFINRRSLLLSLCTIFSITCMIGVSRIGSLNFAVLRYGSFVLPIISLQGIIGALNSLSCILLIMIDFECEDCYVADMYNMTEFDECGEHKHYPPTFVNCKTYEQACEAAIKYYLENML